VWAGGVSGVLVAGNYIGTDTSGTRALGVRGDGVQLDSPPPAPGVIPTRLGVDGRRPNPAAMRNVISGNVGYGVAAWCNHYELAIAGNYIGTDASGTLPLGNALVGGAGLALGDNALVGSDGDGVGDEFERNVISGNSGAGIVVFGSGNQIAGNNLGTDPTGTF